MVNFTAVTNQTPVNADKGKLVFAGIIGGVLGGSIFGLMLGIMGQLSMIVRLAGGTSPEAGFLTHIVFSAVIGIIFALILGKATDTKTKGITLGLGYGVIWWFAGSLIAIPFWLGMGVSLSTAAMASAMPSLVGHLIYGLILGLIFPRLASAQAGV